jgi:hypothetical protein
MQQSQFATVWECKIYRVTVQSFPFVGEWVKKIHLGRTKPERKAHLMESIITSDAFLPVSWVQIQSRQEHTQSQGPFKSPNGVIAVFHWGVFHACIFTKLLIARRHAKYYAPEIRKMVYFFTPFGVLNLS